jgi:hypothetical protein
MAIHVLVTCCYKSSFTCYRDRCGRGRMVVGFITTYAINAYHHQRCEFEYGSGEEY